MTITIKGTKVTGWNKQEIVADELRKAGFGSARALPFDHPEWGNSGVELPGYGIIVALDHTDGGGLVDGLDRHGNVIRYRDLSTAIRAVRRHIERTERPWSE